MRKAAGLVSFLLLVVMVLLYLLDHFLFFDVSSRFLVTKVIPPRKSAKEYMPLNEFTPSPFTIPKGKTFDIFADLKGGLPKVLAFDESGTLLVSIPNTGKIIALPDEDQNYKADGSIEVVGGLLFPYGIAVNKGYLYVGEMDKISRFVYDTANHKAYEKEVLVKLPFVFGHSSKVVRINKDKLYISIGSSCNVCLEKNPYRGTILVSDLDGKNMKVYARGLRNTLFFAFDENGHIWGNETGRNGLGSTLPPDELNLIEENKNYGWPFCYGSLIRDYKFRANAEITYCLETTGAVYEYPAHVVPKGIAFDGSGHIISALNGMVRSQAATGFKIVKLDVFADKVTGYSDYISGFVQGKNEIIGKPLDLIFDKHGNLFISDDHTGLIFILGN